jgi:hypothetical protein
MLTVGSGAWVLKRCQLALVTETALAPAFHGRWKVYWLLGNAAKV